MQCQSTLNERFRCQSHLLQGLSEVPVFQAFLGTGSFPVGGWGKPAGTVPVSLCWYTCQGRTAWCWRVTKPHRNWPKYNHRSGDLYYSLTCFPSGADVLEPAQRCLLADVIPISAFYTLLFHPGNKVTHERNKNVHHVLEQHYKV